MNSLNGQLVLTADHTTYRIPKLPSEHTNIRLWAVQHQYPRNEAEYQAACNLALYWYYHHKLGCSYNAAVQRKIDSIELKEN